YLRQGDRGFPVDPRRSGAREALALRRHHRARLPHAFAAVAPIRDDLFLLRPQDGRELRPEPGTLHLARTQRLARACALHAAEVRAHRRRWRAGDLERHGRDRRRCETGAHRGMDRTSLLLETNQGRTTFMAQRWQQRPPGSNWGEFGPDDQRGRMNYVTREKVLQGIAEVKEGISFPLSLPLDYPGGAALNPRRSPPRLAATIRDGKSAGRQNFCFPLADDEPDLTAWVADDRVLLTLQYSTQWDSFAHIGSRFDADGDGKREIVFYNGFRAGEDLVPASERRDSEPWARYEGTEARALGIENLAEHGAQARGVMLDLPHH